MINLLVLLKYKTYNFMLVIINQLTKIVYYYPLRVTINILGLAKVKLNIVIWHYGLPNLIFTNKNLLFTFKF